MKYANTKRAPKQFTSWSFSRWKEWRDCPARANFKSLLKIYEPPELPKKGETMTAMERGQKVHDNGQLFLDSYKATRSPAIPPEYKAFESLLRELRMARKKDPAAVEVESTWAYRKDWSETVYNDWDNCWLRIKMDACHIKLDVDDETILARPYDWKTGQYSPKWNLSDYLLQLDLYALGILNRLGDPEGKTKIRVEPKLVFLDQGIVHDTDMHGKTMVYTEKDTKTLTRKWEGLVKPMLADTTFKPKVSNACGRCYFRKSNGGPCTANT